MSSAISYPVSPPEEAARLHRPVMVGEVVSLLCQGVGGVYVDGTVGMGGHAEALLRAAAPERLVGLDWDGSALELARRRLSPWGERVVLVRESFTAIPEVLEGMGVRGVNGILLDLGLSSFFIQESGRGFSFLRNEPLDMRMDDRRELTAYELVNTAPEEQLAEIIRHYGEERWAQRIARFLVERRRKSPIETSAELADLVAGAIPRRFHPRGRHPATRTFQAIRIAVNRELENLKEALDSLPSCLLPGGRLAVISFHSMEDRLVKRAFRGAPRLEAVTKRPLVPSPEEVAENPRARSAKLRVARRRS